MQEPIHECTAEIADAEVTGTPRERWVAGDRGGLWEGYLEGALERAIASRSDRARGPGRRRTRLKGGSG